VCLHLEGQRRDAATVKRRKMAVYCVFVCIWMWASECMVTQVKLSAWWAGL
jgi:hypothetical protein